ncbi:MAG: replicative DNA helicase [Saprospiraceae bacterium]
MSELSNSMKPLSGNRLKPLRGDTDLSSLLYGKIQPQAIPLEEAVLGAMLLDKNALTTVIEILKPSSFYVEAHQLIYESVLQLFGRTHPVDILTVNEELRKVGNLDKIGGPAYLVELTNKVASAANVEFHARIISQKFIQRELIRTSSQIIQDAYDDSKDVFDMLDDAEQNLFKVTEDNLKRSFQKVNVLAVQARNLLESLSLKEDGLTGVPSGFRDLDKITSGWQPSDLIVIAARPGMGKTSFTLALAKNAAIQYQKPVAFFSLEMSSIQLMLRLISLEADLKSDQLRTGKLSQAEWARFNAAVEMYQDAPIFIDDTPQINIFELRAKCRRLKMNHDIGMVVIDYLQLMRAGSDNKNTNREQEISTISRSLKTLAKELEVPVIALSQLNRSTETRSSASKRPMLSDLRESGAIEQDADIVSFIYRPDYYGIAEDEDQLSTEGIAEIIIAKHRNGSLDTVKLRFVKEFAKFTNLDEMNFQGLPFIGGSDPFGNADMVTRQSRFNSPEDEDFNFD